MAIVRQRCGPAARTAADPLLRAREIAGHDDRVPARELRERGARVRLPCSSNARRIVRAS
ncbi:MAG: hypothetical protein ACK52I_21730 [Pseudomonadota bacterium]